MDQKPVPQIPDADPPGAQTPASNFEIGFLSVVAIAALMLFPIVFGAWGLLGWLLYFAVGAPAMRVGLDLGDVIAPQDTGLREMRAMVYAGWIVIVPMLAVAAFVVSMFRWALSRFG